MQVMIFAQKIKINFLILILVHILESYVYSYTLYQPWSDLELIFTPDFDLIYR